MTASASDIGILSACSFLGSVGAALTGFGQAIIFLFFWQIIELAGYDGDFKSAVFIQALSLFSMQPIVLYKARVWANADRRVLCLFVPITLISTPLGQLVSSRVPTDLIQAVAGFLVMFVALWELYSKRNWFMNLCKKNDVAKQEGVNNESSEGNIQTEHEQTEHKEGETDADVQQQLDTNPESLNEDVITEETNTINNSDRHDVEATSTTITPSASMPQSNDAERNAPSVTTSEAPQFKAGINKATFITLLAGGASGFLGGMVAIRGPPLIFYFLHPPYPISFDKNSQRATGVVIMFCNVLMREIFYLVDTFSGSSSSGDIVFVKEDWVLYLAVIVCSIAGSLTGSKLFEFLKDSKDTIRGILAVFLLLCGVSLLFSAFR